MFFHIIFGLVTVCMKICLEYDHCDVLTVWGSPELFGHDSWELMVDFLWLCSAPMLLSLSHHSFWFAWALPTWKPASIFSEHSSAFVWRSAKKSMNNLLLDDFPMADNLGTAERRKEWRNLLSEHLNASQLLIVRACAKFVTSEEVNTGSQLHCMFCVVMCALTPLLIASKITSLWFISQKKH